MLEAIFITIIGSLFGILICAVLISLIALVITVAINSIKELKNGY